MLTLSKTNFLTVSNTAVKEMEGADKFIPFPTDLVHSVNVTWRLQVIHCILFCVMP